MTRQEQALQVLEARFKYTPDSEIYDNYEFDNEEFRYASNTELEALAGITFEEMKAQIRRYGTCF